MAEHYVWPRPFEELDHTADVGVVVRGSSAEECLASLVLSFTSLVLGGSGGLAGDERRAVRVAAGTRANMAVDVLRELLFLFETEHVLPIGCSVVRFDEVAGAEVAVVFAPFDEGEHEDVTDLKAVTLHEALFERAAPGGTDAAGDWIAQIIYDV